MHTRAWPIILTLLFIGGLLSSIQLSGPGVLQGQSAPEHTEAAWQALPTLEATRVSTRMITVTPTPLQPVPPTPTTTRIPLPTQTAEPQPPPPPQLPDNALIKGIYGYGQLLPLSCESRSAADWARHFGIEIHELDFYYALPRSANPEDGFVGSVYGSWGQTPPGPYGVHAAPVAKLLRAYGARAAEMRELSFTALKEEIASGEPVMVWVTGHTTPGKGISYEIDGQTITVAPYEHTVIVIGYDEEKDRVTILDGRDVYYRTYDMFFQSWNALNNMAVIWEN